MPKENKVGQKPRTRKVTPPRKSKDNSLTVPVYLLEGTSSGRMILPKEVFGVEVNKPLLAQAARVYLNNLKAHFSHTKTRSEVRGSTRKIYRQKGTGRARHGAITAPIFVGGGIALGPKYHKVMLDLPKKARGAVLLSALSSKLAEGEVLGIGGLDKASGKTSQMSSFLKKVAKEDALIVVGDKNDKLRRAVSNLPRAEMLPAKEINTLNIISHKTLLLTKEAVKALEERVGIKAKVMSS